MAHPAFIVNQTIQHFYNLWNYGFQPNLSFNTQPDGSIIASCTVHSNKSEVTSFSSHSDQTFTMNHNYRRHMSGQNSRRRRRNYRANSFQSNLVTPNNNVKQQDDDTSPVDEARAIPNETEILCAQIEAVKNNNVVTEKVVAPNSDETLISDQIRLLSEEIERKNRHILKLEVELSTKKFNTYLKQKPTLSMVKVSCHDIPPAPVFSSDEPNQAEIGLVQNEKVHVPPPALHNEIDMNNPFPNARIVSSEEMSKILKKYGFTEE